MLPPFGCFLLLAALVAGAFQGVSAQPAPVAGISGNFSAFLDAVNRTQLGWLLQNGTAFNGTLLLPTDQAFSNLANEANVSLTKVLSSNYLVALVTYHLVVDELSRFDLPEGLTNVTTLNGLNLTLTKYGNITETTFTNFTQAANNTHFQNITDFASYIDMLSWSNVTTVTDSSNMTYNHTYATAFTNITITDEGNRTAQVLAADIRIGSFLVYVIDTVLVPAPFINLLQLPPMPDPRFSPAWGLSPLAPPASPTPTPAPAPSPSPAPSSPASPPTLQSSVINTLMAMNLTVFATLLQGSGLVINTSATILPPTNEALLAAFAQYAAFTPGLDFSALNSGDYNALPPDLRTFLVILVRPVIAPGRAYTLAQLTNNKVVGALTVARTSLSVSVKLTAFPSQRAKLTGLINAASLNGISVSIFATDTLILDVTAIGR